MDIVSGQHAVITGAASGIGLALAKKCAAEGMRISMADLPGERLTTAEAGLRAGGADVQAYGVDVGDGAAVDRFAHSARARFGPVHLLSNNAGIIGIKRKAWNFSPADWRRLLDVNLFGVIHGIRAFAAQMVEQDDGHIINTSSLAGLVAMPMSAGYCASKAGIVSVSEVLSIDLQRAGSRVGVSVFIPGLVKTDIGASRTSAALGMLDPEERACNESAISDHAQGGIEAAEAANMMLSAVREKRFFVITSPEVFPFLERRLHVIKEGGDAFFPG